MRICLLASGSRGNAVYIESGSTRLLVDAGLSGREMTRRLQEIGVDPEQLDAILVTHEHRDHCQGLGPMARRYKLPVYIHPGEIYDSSNEVPEIYHPMSSSPPLFYETKPFRPILISGIFAI